MKHFSINSYKFGTLDRGNTPLPFPGMYPTRWKIVVGFKDHRNDKETRVFSYFGKPNKTIAQRVRYLIRNKYGRIWYQEGDRGGVFKYGTWVIPIQNLAVQEWNRLKEYFYYPWDDSGNRYMITPWAEIDFSRISLKENGRKYILYSPWAEVEQERIEEFAEWLSTSKLEFRK